MKEKDIPFWEQKVHPITGFKTYTAKDPELLKKRKHVEKREFKTNNKSNN